MTRSPVHIILSRTSGVPIYEQIKVQCRAAVHSGDLPEGALLPSLRQLAAQLRVSLITVTRAYNDLVSEGLVTNEHGRGFVVKPIDQELAHAALTERFERALTETITMARAAKIGWNALQERVEREWNQ
ncbi:MAG: GntR family transcriptional regulator [Lacisediminihabitans sp.]